MPTERLHRNLSEDCDELRRRQEAPDGFRRSQGKGPLAAPGDARRPQRAQGGRQEAPGRPLGDPRSGRLPESSMGVHSLTPRLSRIRPTRQRQGRPMKTLGVAEGPNPR